MIYCKSVTFIPINTTFFEGDLAELGVIVQEYDKLESRYRTLNSDTADVEKQFLAICLKFKSERDEWRQEQIR